MTDSVRSVITGAVLLKQQILDDATFLERITAVANLMVKRFQGGGKVLFCGNGGSAADAQHLAAELSGRFYYDRPPLPAEALHVNTSYLTAVANDYGYDEVFARMVKGLGNPGDILVGLSTSGNSPNVLRAFEAARENGMTVVALTGTTGGSMASMADVLLNVPSNDTPRIQEVHILIGHILCELVERTMFPQQEDQK